jgi:hypothetical protein
LLGGEASQQPYLFDLQATRYVDQVNEVRVYARRDLQASKPVFIKKNNLLNIFVKRSQICHTFATGFKNTLLFCKENDDVSSSVSGYLTFGTTCYLYGEDVYHAYSCSSSLHEVNCTHGTRPLELIDIVPG